MPIIYLKSVLKWREKVLFLQYKTDSEGEGSLTTWSDKGKIDVSSEGPSKALLTPDEGPSLETSIFPLSFQVVREPLPFAYHWIHYLHWQR